MESLSTPRGPRCACNDARCAAHEGRSLCGYARQSPKPKQASLYNALCRGCANALAREVTDQLELPLAPRRRVVRP